MHAAWWGWALGAWAVITVLGLLRVDITGRVLGVLLTAEIVVILIETVAGLAHPAGGHLSFATLSPAALTSAGFGTFGVLAVVAVLGFVGFEQAPVLAEEARNARRTIPVATYVALGMIAVRTTTSLATIPIFVLRTRRNWVAKNWSTASTSTAINRSRPLEQYACMGVPMERQRFCANPDCFAHH